MFENEEVEEREGKEFAKEIGAIFQTTSPRESIGIEDLFYKIGRKILNPIETEGASSFNQENRPKEQKLKEERRKKNNCYIF